MDIETIRDYPRLSMVSLNKNKEKTNKAFILFGEHARELISPETGLHFVKKLCQESEDLKEIKDDYELRMIVNLNPLSREKVEQGDFCKRENENGVDLNRNYKSHWTSVKVIVYCRNTIQRWLGLHQVHLHFQRQKPKP